ncbi:MAG: tRNA-dihydrouridine synthase [Bdellovibrionota bacterium]
MKFNTPIQIGKLEIKNRVFLAPLAGVSDIPFRRICQELGAGLTYVEMLSSVAIKYNSKRTFQMMDRHKSESILGVQVTGGNAADVAAAVTVLDKQGFETIDINMGCPVRKVVSAGCGSAILKDPERITDTVLQCRSATQKPLSAKFRLGYTREQINVDNTVDRVVSSHVDMFTIHGRTRSESYSTPCDYSGIKLGLDVAVKKQSSVVKVGNGDIFDFKTAQKMYAETGCDAVMVSRGALGNPWIFAEILAEKSVQPSIEEWFDVVCRHLDYQKEYFGDTKLAAILMRKHLLWYAKGFPNSKGARNILNQVESLEQAKEVLLNFKNEVPAHFVRFEGFGIEPVAENQNSSDYDPKYEMDRTLDRGVGDDGLPS